MPQQLLQEAIQRAEGSAPAVQAAALVHCARVMTKFDKVTADQLLERGITVTQSLSPDERSLLLEEFPSIAAGTNPRRAIELYELLEKKESGPDRLLFAMLGHGHISEAVTYLSSKLFRNSFEYSTVHSRMWRRANLPATRKPLSRMENSCKTDSPKSWRSVPRLLDPGPFRIGRPVSHQHHSRFRL